MPRSYLSPIEDILDDARNGRMFILIDDESRENEGDLVIPAQMATPDAINFMAKFGRGLICLALTGSRAKELGLELMAPLHNRSRHQTAFTVSIEAAEGVTTGISAADRAHTISVAIDPNKIANDIATPGHVFPLVSRDGGVLVRAGHTEAAVDIARIAGLLPAGAICEIMNDDGTMARLPDLVKFAQFHGLKVAAIADLIAYRRRHDNLIEAAPDTELEIDSIHGGKFKFQVYVNKAEYAEHIALVMGDVTTDEPVLVRMHHLNIFDDLFAVKGLRAGQFHRAMKMIGEAGRGVIVIIRDVRSTSLSDHVHRLTGKQRPQAKELRDYGIGAQILLDLGVKDMILLSNTKRNIVGLDGYGLTVVDQLPIVEGDPAS
ncbi:MAG: 3,4-dihydroxy-2-butanone-4-phosphate synthase [Sphingomonadales bacterium]